MAPLAVCHLTSAPVCNVRAQPDSVHSTVYSIQYTVYNLQYTVYSIKCTLYSIQNTVYTLQYTIYSIQITLYSVQGSGTHIWCSQPFCWESCSWPTLCSEACRAVFYKSQTSEADGPVTQTGFLPVLYVVFTSKPNQTKKLWTCTMSLEFLACILLSY